MKKRSTSHSLSESAETEFKKVLEQQRANGVRLSLKEKQELFKHGLFPAPMTIVDIPEDRLPAEILEAKELVSDLIIDENGKRLRRVLVYSGVARNHINSWNDWVDNDIVRTVTTAKPIPFRGSYITFTNVKMEPSTRLYGGQMIPMTPAYCIDNDKTYSFEISFQLTLVDKNGQRVSSNEEDPVIHFGSIPQMIKGHGCILEGKDPETQDALKWNPNNPGGFFIIGGQAYVIEGQDQGRNHVIFNTKPNNGHPNCRIVVSHQGKTFQNQIIRGKHGVLHIPIPSLKKPKNTVRGKSSPEKSMNVFHFFHMIGIAYNVDALRDPAQVGELIKEYLLPGEESAIYQLNITEERSYGPQDGINALSYWAMKVEMKHKRSMVAALSNPQVRAEWDNFMGIKDHPGDAAHYINLFRETFETHFFPHMSEIENMLLKIWPGGKGTELQEAGYQKSKALHDKYFQKRSAPRNEDEVKIAERYHTVRMPYRVYILAEMLAGFIATLANLRPVTDRNDYGFKSFKMSGFWMRRQFNTIFNGWRNEINAKINEKSPPEISRITEIKADPDKTLTEPFETAFKWFWSVKGQSKRLKVATLLDRTNLISILSHLGRISANIDRKGVQLNVRKKKGTEFNIICMAKTPDNSSVGINRNLALTTLISIDRLDLGFFKIITHMTLQVSDPTSGEVTERIYPFVAPESGIKVYCPVFKRGAIGLARGPENEFKRVPANAQLWLNAKNLGWCNFTTMFRFLVKLKRRGRLPRDSCIGRNVQQTKIEVFTDSGRATAPYLIVNRHFELKAYKAKETRGSLGGRPFQDLLEHGVAEYVDARELGFLRIATSEVEVQAQRENYLKIQRQITKHQTRIADLEDENTELLDREEQGDQLSDLELQQLDRYEAEVNNLKNQIKELEEQLQLIRKNRFTHMIFDPTGNLGVSASLLPMVQTIPGPRAIIASAHIDQAIGLYDPHEATLFHGNIKSLVYPVAPFFATQTMKLLGIDKSPQGMDAILMFNAVPNTEEDSMVLNADTAQLKGLGRTVTTKVYELTVKFNINSTVEETLIKPPKEECIPQEEYDRKYQWISDHPQCSGLPYIGAYLTQGQCIIGAVQKDTQDRNKITWRNISKFVEVNDQGRVDDVYVTRDEKSMHVKVKLVHVRMPTVGQKIAARNAQKATIGEIVPRIDLPFNHRIGSPDVVLNPTQLPSRMTMSYPWEQFFGLQSALRGMRVDATSFREIDSGDVSQVLYEYGWHWGGLDTWYSGKTGKPLKAPLMSGPVYIQWLKHQPEDKIRSKAIGGPVCSTTRAPAKGIKKGSTKSGGQELDVLLSHGASAMIRSRYLLLSNPYEVMICKCGALATSQNKGYVCKLCKNERQEDFGRHITPYTCKNFFHSIMALGFNPRLDTVKRPQKSDPERKHNVGFIVAQELARRAQGRPPVEEKSDEETEENDEGPDNDLENSDEEELELSEEEFSDYDDENRIDSEDEDALPEFNDEDIGADVYDEPMNDYDE
jgi:DNA-directed RNA polymerase beta subunit